MTKLREQPVGAAERVRAGATRAGLVIASPMLVLIEVAAFGVPASMLGQVLGGSTDVPAGPQRIVVAALLVALLAAALCSARTPMTLAASWRGANGPWLYSFAAVLADRGGPPRDPHAASPAFEPLRPRLPNLALVAVLVAHTVSWTTREPADDSPVRPSEIALPGWLGPAPIAWLGYLLAAVLAGAWLVALVRAAMARYGRMPGTRAPAAPPTARTRRGGPPVRHSVLAAAAAAFVFAGYAGYFAEGSYRGEDWNIGTAGMALGVFVGTVAVATARWWLLVVGLVGALVATLAESGTFASSALILPLVLSALLVAAIVWRSLRGGPMPVPMPYRQRVRLNRIVLGLVAVKWLIAAVLVLGWGRLLMG